VNTIYLMLMPVLLEKKIIQRSVVVS
jgi:hypothetical protein